MFFTHLDQVMRPGLDYNLTISKTEMGLTVLFMPRANGLEDKAQNNLVPLTFRGTPQELDANFLPGIATPVRQVSALLTNMAEFEKSAKKVAAESKAAKERKDIEDKEAKAKKEKFDSFMRKAEEQEKAGNLEDAKINLQQARLHSTEKTVKAVDDKLNAIREKLSQGSLFDVSLSVAPAIQPALSPAAIPATAVPATDTPAGMAVPANATHGLFAQPAEPVAPAPAIQTPPSSSGAGGITPGHIATLDNKIARDGEYDEYIDFPKEMQPPHYNGSVKTGINENTMF